jgi:hypothetical protein
MAITILATKAGRSGKPAVEISFDAGTKLDEILAAQRAVFGDKALAKAIGLKFCGGCYSGLDLDIKQKYERVVQQG